MEPTTISVEVQRALTEWEMSDVRQAVDLIVKHTTFFFGGDDPLGDEVREFLANRELISNVEYVSNDEAG